MPLRGMALVAASRAYMMPAAFRLMMLLPMMIRAAASLYGDGAATPRSSQGDITRSIFTCLTLLRLAFQILPARAYR